MMKAAEVVEQRRLAAPHLGMIAAYRRQRQQQYQGRDQSPPHRNPLRVPSDKKCTECRTHSSFALSVILALRTLLTGQFSLSHGGERFEFRLIDARHFAGKVEMNSRDANPPST